MIKPSYASLRADFKAALANFLVSLSRRLLFLEVAGRAALIEATFLVRSWNFSTRRAVSTNFCLPVKNGWQFEHTSI